MKEVRSHGCTSRCFRYYHKPSGLMKQGLFGVVSLIGLFFFQRTGREIPLVTGLQFFFLISPFCSWNTIFELGVLSYRVLHLFLFSDGNHSFALEAVHINALDYFCKFAYGELYVTQCSLPRAILGLDIILWFKPFSIC